MTDDGGELVAAERGQWLDVVSACRVLGVTERTIQRRVGRGEIRRRALPGGRAEFWIGDDMAGDVSGLDDEASTGVAVLRQQEALMVRLAELARADRAPLEELVISQAEELGRLRAELSRLSADLSAAKRPWWLRWLGSLGA